MSYEYKNEIIMNIKDYNAGRKVTGGTHAFESKLEELDRVYARATKADEYEAKAKALDALLHTYERYRHSHAHDLKLLLGMKAIELLEADE